MFIAIDFGKKRIGLALGEEIPHPAGVVDAQIEKNKIIEKISAICAENEVEGIVIGMPYLASGSLGNLSTEIGKFANELADKLQLPVFFEEEQYTSVEAKSLLEDHHIGYDRKRGEIDEMAAVLILEQFLNRRRSEGIKPDIEVK